MELKGTVKELADWLLKNFDENTPIYITDDNAGMAYAPSKRCPGYRTPSFVLNQHAINGLKDLFDFPSFCIVVKGASKADKEAAAKKKEKEDPKPDATTS